MRVAEPITTDPQTERELRALSKGRRVEARVQQRASLILLAAQGWQNKDIADAVKLDRRQVALWRKRFNEGGLEALLQDASRPGRPPRVTPTIEWQILRTTLTTSPGAAAVWSTRSLAARLGLSASTVRRVWQRHGIQPHVPGTPGAARDRPRFADARTDVLGLQADPRGQVLALACDPRHPTLVRGRARPWRARAPAHEGARHGTSALLTALAGLDAALAPAPGQRHRRALAFLRSLHRQASSRLRLHLVVGGRASHPHPEVRAWLARHPRVVLHELPARGPWLTGVQRLLRAVFEQPIRHDAFSRVPELLRSIERYIGLRPEQRAPFVWMARPASPARARGAQTAARSPAAP